ncbi:MAG: hypothetical protein NC300_07635 [Bacteroidales bacterium]|nr:hypothetical protein [Bacteroidales bacterium]
MNDVYQVCPQFENEKYLLRFILEEDCPGLLKVYSDKETVPLSNSDNRDGDDFYYCTESRMKQVLDY